MATQSLSALATASIHTISITRMIAGGSMLLTPQLGSKIFGIPLAPESDVVGRLFGVRDFVMGALLWIARSNLAQNLLKSDSVLIRDATRDLSRVLWVGIVVDSVDVCSCVVSILSGEMKGRAIPLVAGGAASFIGLASLALRRL